jgi:hypothetical protein
MARVVDLTKLHDGKDTWYEFRISAAPGDFERTIAKLKQFVPHEGGGRVYDGDRKMWAVREDYADTVLMRLFENWTSAHEALESQGALF